MLINYSTNRKDIIEDIRNNADIVNIVGSYISLKKKGINYFGLCPFHDDHDPSLSVNPKKQIFKCFVCGTGGDVFTFVSKYEKISYIDAVVKVGEKIHYDANKLKELKEVNQKYKDKWTEEQKRLVLALQRAQTFFSDFLFDPNHQAGINYLKSRGLNEELINQFGLGLAINDKALMKEMLTNENNYFPNLDDPNLKFNATELWHAGLLNENLDFYYANRVTFPIRNQNGTIIAYSARSLEPNVEPKYLLTVATDIFNKSHVLYNLDSFFKNDEVNNVYITEGFMDTIACVRAGFTNTVATMGTSLGSEQIKLLRQLKKLKRIILALDNDKAGLKANLDIGMKLLENGFNVSVVDYQGIDAKDADEIIQKYGTEKLKYIFTNNRTDFLTFFINKTINPHVPKDEMQDQIEKAIDLIAVNGTTLNTTDLLKHLANISQISLEGIQASFNEKKSKLFPTKQNFSSFNNQDFVQKQRHEYDPKPQELDQKGFVDSLSENLVSSKIYLNIDNRYKYHQKQCDKLCSTAIGQLNLLLFSLISCPKNWKEEYEKQIGIALNNLQGYRKVEVYLLLLKIIKVYIDDQSYEQDQLFQHLDNEINSTIEDSMDDEENLNRYQKVKDLLHLIKHQGLNYMKQYDKANKIQFEHEIKKSLESLLSYAFLFKRVYQQALKLQTKIKQKKVN